jgi:hypothetical protein
LCSRSWTSGQAGLTESAGDAVKTEPLKTTFDLCRDEPSDRLRVVVLSLPARVSSARVSPARENSFHRRWDHVSPRLWNLQCESRQCESQDRVSPARENSFHRRWDHVSPRLWNLQCESQQCVSPARVSQDRVSPARVSPLRGIPARVQSDGQSLVRANHARPRSVGDRLHRQNPRRGERNRVPSAWSFSIYPVRQIAAVRIGYPAMGHAVMGHAVMGHAAMGHPPMGHAVPDQARVLAPRAADLARDVLAAP